jgi:putative ABC transport system substrate-binding protein
MPPELFGKWLELLKEVVPNLSAVAVLWRPKNITSRLGWNAIQLPARQLKVQLHSIEVRSPNDDVVKIFQEAERARAGALVSMPAVYKKLLADLEAKIHLPAIYINSRYVEAGGLMSYGPNWADVYHRAATYVDKILKGAKPADLPVEQPRKYVLTINLKTAKKLGLTISPDMLYRADKVIK